MLNQRCPICDGQGNEGYSWKNEECMSCPFCEGLGVLSEDREVRMLVLHRAQASNWLPFDIRAKVERLIVAEYMEQLYAMFMPFPARTDGR